MIGRTERAAARGGARGAAVREDGGMSAPELAPRRTFPALIAVWVVAALVAIAIGIFVPVDWRMAWMTVGLGACVILTFAVQLAQGTSKGFIDRVALSAVGSLLVMGIISAVFGLATIIPGSVFPG